MTDQGAPGWLPALLAHLLHPPTACLLLALASGAMVLTALGLEYLAGLPPCSLCIWQRYPHVALTALGLLGWRVWPRAVLALAVLILLGEAGLAVYHVGVEQGWWALPASCAIGATATSVAELKRLMADAPPACDQVSFSFLGLSLTGWNVVASLGLAVYASAAALGLGGRLARDRLAATEN